MSEDLAKINEILKGCCDVTLPKAKVARLYLEKRGLNPDSIPDGVLFHEKLELWVDGKRRIQPGLIFIVSGKDSIVCGLQRIFLKKDGSGYEEKKMLGAVGAGILRFGEIGPECAVAEGPETALAVFQATKLPTLCALSTSGMKNLKIPDEVKKIRIYADKDQNGAGLRAAIELKRKCDAKSIDSDVFLPPWKILFGEKSIDWLDVLNEFGAGQICSAKPIAIVDKYTVYEEDRKIDPFNSVYKFLNDLMSRSHGAGLNLVGGENQTFKFDGFCFSEITDNQIEDEFAKWFPREYRDEEFRSKLTPSLLKTARVIIKTSLPKVREVTHTPNRSAVNFENGFILPTEIKHKPQRLRESTNSLFFRNYIPFEYNSSATSDKWVKFLEETLDVQEILCLQEWFGYNLTADTSREKFMILLGEGANGKSVVLRVLKLMLGGKNVSSVRLEQMVSGRTFVIAGTDGKLANIASELSINSVKDVELLKGYVTGEEMQVEHKFQAPFSMKPSAKLTFSTNTLPEFNDGSGGLWRRLIIVPFNNVVAPEKRNPDMLEAAYWRSEMPGIINWALEGLQRLCERGYFSVSDKMEETVREHRRGCNFEQTYLLENYDFVEGSSVNSYDLYSCYAEECSKFKRPVMTKQQFAKEVKRTFSKAEAKSFGKGINGKRSRNWVGLKRI